MSLQTDETIAVPTENNNIKDSKKKEKKEKKKKKKKERCPTIKLDAKFDAWLRDLIKETDHSFLYLWFYIALTFIFLVLFFCFNYVYEQKRQALDECSRLEHLRESRISELEGTIQNLTEQLKMEQMRMNSTEEDILTNIVGSWEMVSSKGVETFLEECKKTFNPDPIWLAAYQVGIPHFQFDHNASVLTVYSSVGSHTLEKMQYKIGELQGSGEDVYSMTVQHNALVLNTVGGDGEELQISEMFVKEGLLFMVDERFGLKSKRIYKKMGKSV